MIKQRNIALCIVFSIITFGIYALYWFVCLTNDANQESGQTDATSGGVALLLTIVTCNIYGWFWAYKMGEKIDAIKTKNGQSAVVGGDKEIQSMDQIQKSRRNAIIKRDAILVGIGILYYIFIRVTGLAIPCIFRKITGFLCPGCGITRAILAAVRLDLAKAFAYNQFMFIALPALAYIIVKNDYVFVRYGNRKLSRFDNILIFICIAGAVMFAVLRNVMRF